MTSFATARLADLIEHVKTVAHEVATSEEHAVVAFIVPGRDSGLPVDAVVPCIPAALPNDAAKDGFADFIRDNAKEMRADAVIVIMEVYLSHIMPDEYIRNDRDLLTQARASPTRQEALLCSVEQKLGATLMYYAPIGVDGGIGARRVGPFVQMPAGFPLGRFSGLVDDGPGASA